MKHFYILIKKYDFTFKCGMIPFKSTPCVCAAIEIRIRSRTIFLRRWKIHFPSGPHFTAYKIDAFSLDEAIVTCTLYAFNIGKSNLHIDYLRK